MLTHIRVKNLHIKVNNLTQEGPEEENHRRWNLNIQPLMAVKRIMKEG